MKQHIFFVKSILAFMFFTTISVFGQSGIVVHWQNQTGCQTYSQNENPRDPKEGVFIEQIGDSECIQFCENAPAWFFLTGSLSPTNTTVWDVVGGVITSSDNENCYIDWGGG